MIVVNLLKIKPTGLKYWIFDCIFLFQDGCMEIVLATDKPFRRLDHYKMHEYSRRGHQTPTSSSMAVLPSTQINNHVHSSGSSVGSSGKEICTFTTSSPSSTSFSLDSMFRRKRGRPPKNRVIEVWNESVRKTRRLN